MLISTCNKWNVKFQYSCIRMWEVEAESQDGKEAGQASSRCLRADTSIQGGSIIGCDLSAMPSLMKSTLDNKVHFTTVKL